MECKYDRFVASMVGLLIGAFIMSLRYESYDALLAMQEPTLYNVAMLGAAFVSVLFDLASLFAFLYLWIVLHAGLSYRRAEKATVLHDISWLHRALMARVKGD